MVLKHIFQILTVAFCTSGSKSYIFSDCCQIRPYLSSLSLAFDFNLGDHIVVSKMYSYNYASWMVEVMILFHCL